MPVTQRLSWGRRLRRAGFRKGNEHGGHEAADG
ncbi:conserved hypothetical protein [Streptomyces albidoflavus]|nr:conserved hypothetical protein [Streptomyces albidoflavus]